MHDARSPACPPCCHAFLQRTKAGAKLAVPRPVNLPSLKKVGVLPCFKFLARLQPAWLVRRAPNPFVRPNVQENAGSEPSTTAGSTGGWAGAAATVDHDQQHSSHAAGDAAQQPASSLVEKASWAGQGRPAGPAPWESGPPQRSLNPREFPSLAAAAAVPQQPHGHRAPTPPHAADSGAWDEDERGRGLPAAPCRPLSAERGRSRERLHPGDRGDGYGPRVPPPHYYGRLRGEASPHRRFGDDGYGVRYGGPGGREPYWRDEPPPRDWHPRHDRCVRLLATLLQLVRSLC